VGDSEYSRHDIIVDLGQSLSKLCEGIVERAILETFKVCRPRRFKVVLIESIV
jgi:hypothetical protein